MSDNLLGYSNSGLAQSLNGISTISDGDGASISNGNLICLDTNTNTITINNVMTIPILSQINLYGGIYLPDFSILINQISMYNMYNDTNTNKSSLNGITYNTTDGTNYLTNNVTFLGSIVNFGNSLQTIRLNINTTASLYLYGQIY